MAKYEEWLTAESLLRIQGWARDGLTDSDIAKNIGVARATLQQWKKSHADIANVLKVNKDIADRRIENALYEKALSGDTRAMIFWLKNRNPEAWQDKKDVEHSGEIGIASVLEDARKRALNASR